MEKIIITPLVYDKVDEIIMVLYKDEYCGFIDTAKSYGDAILNFIITIPQQKRKLTINPRFGKYYCRYRHDKGTVYYITFDIDNGDYFIQNIISNHTSEYPLYIIDSNV